jgi:hypothetical protein
MSPCRQRDCYRPSLCNNCSPQNGKSTLQEAEEYGVEERRSVNSTWGGVYEEGFQKNTKCL